MRPSLLVSAAALTVLIAGCGSSAQDQSDMVATTNSATLVDDSTGSEAEADAPSATMATPAPTPTPSDALAVPPPAYAPDTGPNGAVAVIKHYYDAIDRGDFDTAYADWRRDGAASKQTFAQFKRGFAQTASTSVETGSPTDGEGAAGSVYITVPVTVHATLKDGTKQTFAGSYVLRRVNEVPGATAEDLRWHLYSANLKPA